ncbi:uncharacterized protein GJ701_010614 [Geothlypis trichas]
MCCWGLFLRSPAAPRVPMAMSSAPTAPSWCPKLLQRGLSCSPGALPGGIGHPRGSNTASSSCSGAGWSVGSCDIPAGADPRHGAAPRGNSGCVRAVPRFPLQVFHTCTRGTQPLPRARPLAALQGLPWSSSSPRGRFPWNSPGPRHGSCRVGGARRGCGIPGGWSGAGSSCAEPPGSPALLAPHSLPWTQVLRPFYPLVPTPGLALVDFSPGLRFSIPFISLFPVLDLPRWISPLDSGSPSLLAPFPPLDSGSPSLSSPCSQSWTCPDGFLPWTQVLHPFHLLVPPPGLTPVDLSLPAAVWAGIQGRARHRGTTPCFTQ